MIRIGITGSIASGKSTVATMFKTLGAAIFDADNTVHELLRHDIYVQHHIHQHFPEAWVNGHIHRPTLSRLVFEDHDKLHILETILHPAVRHKEATFLRRAKQLGTQIAICDIPLLFETNAHLRMDYSILVSCPPLLQRQRALKRPHMTTKKLDAILTKQMPVYQKRKYADFEIQTGLGKAYSMKKVKEILAHISRETHA